MFEKEAEEYADKDFGMYEPTDHERYAKETDWRNGAEFGYNKANEWHYVKDGDYPKDNNHILLYVGSRFNCITGWRHRGVWYFDDNRNLKIWQDEVIAWKEITPPKEIKEND